MAAQLPRKMKEEKIRRGKKRLDEWFAKKRQEEEDFNTRIREAKKDAKDVYIKRVLNEALDEIEVLTGMIGKALKLLEEKENLTDESDKSGSDKI